VTTAFVKRNSNITLKTKKDLSNYKLARVRGVKHTDYISANMPHVVESSSTSNMFKLLEQGTIDIALTDYEDGMLALSQIDIRHHIIPYPMTLARFDLYHYIHKSHRYLVKKVDNKIKELKASGELDKITQNARHEVFSVLNFEDSVTNQ
jgi:ABC-type amino acid transport substrate-binding protein